MIPLSSAISGGLTWSKLSRNRGYELKVNDELLGTLHRPSFWSCNVVAETQGGRWLFRRGGFLGTGSAIVDAASDQTIATFKSSWAGGGVLTFVDGQTFHLECRGWWRPVRTVSAGGQPVVALHTREKTVDLLSAAGVAGDRLSLLILFAWHRVLQAEEDAASAVAAVAS